MFLDTMKTSFKNFSIASKATLLRNADCKSNLDFQYQRRNLKSLF